MSRVTGSSSSGWTQDPYLMRFAATFGAAGWPPHPGMTSGPVGHHPQGPAAGHPGMPSMTASNHHVHPVVHPPPHGSSVGSTARGTSMTSTGPLMDTLNSHQYNNPGGPSWTGQSPGPFGILPHQESPARSSSVTSQGSVHSNVSSHVVPSHASSSSTNHTNNHGQHNQGTSNVNNQVYGSSSCSSSSSAKATSSNNNHSNKSHGNPSHHHSQSTNPHPNQMPNQMVPSNPFYPTHQPSNPAADQYLAAMMHHHHHADQANSYSRYMTSQHMLHGMTGQPPTAPPTNPRTCNPQSGASSGPSSNSTRASNTMHHTSNHHAMHHPNNYAAAMNPFTAGNGSQGVDRFTRELMSAAYAPNMHHSFTHQQTMHAMHQQQMQHHHQSQSSMQHHHQAMMADFMTNPASHWPYPPGIVHPPTSSSRHIMTQRGSAATAVPPNGPTGAFPGWMGYPGQGHPSQVMHVEKTPSAKHPSYLASQSNNGNHSNNQCQQQSEHPFNNYLSTCMTQPAGPMMVNHSPHTTHSRNRHENSSSNNGYSASAAGSPAAATSTTSQHLLNGNSNGSGSRCSSVASNHASNMNNIQGEHASGSCSFSGYNSNNHSPRGSTYSTSHTPTPVAKIGNQCQQQNTSPSSVNYPSSQISRVSPPSLGNNGVSNANGVSSGGEDSSHGLSQSHFPLTPQSGSSYYSSSSGYSSSGNGSQETNGVGNGVPPQGSCMVNASYLHSSQQQPNPPSVSITGGETDPTLDPSVYTEQEIDFPSISYEGNVQSGNLPSSSGNRSSGSKEKKKKDKLSKKVDKKKKEKAKQVAAADRLALSAAFDPSIINPFGPPLMNIPPPFGHHHAMNALIDSVIPPINPYAMGLTPLPPPVVSSAALPVVVSTLPVVSSTGIMPSNGNFHNQQPVQPTDHSQMVSEQQVVQTNASPVVSANPVSTPSADKSHVSFAELEDDLRLLTEGSATSNVQLENNRVTATTAVTTTVMNNELPSSFENDETSNTRPQVMSSQNHCDQQSVQQQDWPTSHAVSTEVDSHKLAEAEDLLADLIKKEEEKKVSLSSSIDTTKEVHLQIRETSPVADVVAKVCSIKADTQSPLPVKKNNKRKKTTEDLVVNKKKVKQEDKIVTKVESPEVVVIAMKTTKKDKNSKTSSSESTASKVKVDKTKKILSDKQSKASPLSGKKSPKTVAPKPSKDKKPPVVKTEAINPGKEKKVPKNSVEQHEKNQTNNHRPKQVKEGEKPSKSIPSLTTSSMSVKKDLVNKLSAEVSKTPSLFERISAIPTAFDKVSVSNGTSKSSSKRKLPDVQEIKTASAVLTSKNNNKSIDEYEFNESPSEPAKKKSKKTVDTAVVSVPKTTKNKKEKITSVEEKKMPSNDKKPDVQKTEIKFEAAVKKESIKVNKSTGKVVKDVKDALKKEVSAPKAVPKSGKGQSVKANDDQTSKPVAIQPHPQTNGTQKVNKTSNGSAPSVPRAGKEPPKKVTIDPNVTNVSNGTPQATAKTSLATAPRRRSSDKKALTIKEGLMRTGDFVVSMEEMKQELPMIWRIEGKSLLQRFEPMTQEDGITVYINTSSYSAWNPTVRTRYRGVDVRIMGCSRTKIVVEKLGLTKNSPVSGTTPAVAVNGTAGGTDASTATVVEQEPDLPSLQENFEVYIQTLLSQALDPNFIAEIVKENDDYFLSNVQAIDDVCCRKKSRFTSKIKWDANITKCIESFPSVSCQALKNEHDLRCRLCQEKWSTNMFSFSGGLYDPLSLESRDTTIEGIKQTKYASCDSCKIRVLSFSRLHHSKYLFFLKCQRKVSLSLMVTHN